MSMVQVPFGQVVDDKALILDLVTASLTSIRTQYHGDLCAQPIGKGPFAAYNKDDFTASMTDGDEHRGRAVPIWWLNLRHIPSNVSYNDLQSASKQFDVLSLIDQGVTDIDWKQAIPVQIDPNQDMTHGLGQIGNISLKMLGKAKTIYGFLQSWHNLCTTPSETIPESKLEDAHNMFKRAAQHVPLDFFKVSTADPRAQWLKRFQLVEDHAVAAQEHGHSAWDICCEYTELMALTLQASGDGSVDTVEKYLYQNVTYADRSEYKCTSKSKSVDIATSCHKKLTAAKCQSIMLNAKAEFANRGPFCQMSKLAKMCQRCKDDHMRLRWVVHVVYLRLKTEKMSVTVSKDEFDKDVLLPTLELYDLAMQIPKSFCQRIGAAKDVEWIETACNDPFYLHNKFLSADEKAKVTTMKSSSKHLVKWLDAAYSCQWDDVLVEMAANCRTQQPVQKIEYEKLNLTAVVHKLLDKEEADTKSEAAMVQARLEMQRLHDESQHRSAQLSSDDEDISAKARAEQEAQSKEQLITCALDTHCENIVSETFVQEIRPSLAEGWNTVMSSHDFVKHRHDTTGNTLFYYDAGLDRDSVAQDKQNPQTVLPTMDTPTAKAFIEASEDHCLSSERDIMGVADAKNRAILSACRKLCKRTVAHAEDLTITYKPGSTRGRQRCSERVLFTSGKPIPFNPDQRLYYVQTDCTTDVIVGADNYECAPMVTKAEKEGVLGLSGLSAREQSITDANKELILLNHEKAPQVIEELIHQCGCKKIITPTVGLISLSVAVLKRGGTALLLFRNETHRQVWKAKLLEWLRLEVSTNPKFVQYYLSRSDIIRRLRLAPDGPAAASVPLDDAAPSGTQAAPVTEQEYPGHGSNDENTGDEPGLYADDEVVDPTLDLFGNYGDAEEPVIANEEPAERAPPPAKRARGNAKPKAKGKAVARLAKKAAAAGPTQ